MAPRANWKGYLRLSLVSCPIELYPATSESEKVSFHQINRKTGNRIKMLRVDSETGKPVDYEDVAKGYEVEKGRYVEITEEELEAIDIGSTRTIDIDQFVPKDEIDQLYNIRPYYIAPDGDVAQQAFAVIRKAIDKEAMVALGRIVLTSREHVMALEPRGKGLMGTLLRYPYEVRDEKEYFSDITKQDIPADMLDLAVHIVRSKQGHFDPSKFEDRYEEALKELIRKKTAGEPIKPVEHRESAKVINLMDALKRSVQAAPDRSSGHRSSTRKRPATSRKPARKAHGSKRKAS